MHACICVRVGEGYVYIHVGEASKMSSSDDEADFLTPPSTEPVETVQHQERVAYRSPRPEVKLKEACLPCLLLNTHSLLVYKRRPRLRVYCNLVFMVYDNIIGIWYTTYYFVGIHA